MKPGIREDDLLLDVWKSCARNDRPQDVFRAMLRRGLMAMVEAGEMPDAVVEECDLDRLLERRSRRRVRGVAAGYPVAAEPQPPHAYSPPPHPAPAPHPKPTEDETPRDAPGGAGGDVDDGEAQEVRLAAEREPARERHERERRAEADTRSPRGGSGKRKLGKLM